MKSNERMTGRRKEKRGGGQGQRRERGRRQKGDMKVPDVTT